MRLNYMVVIVQFGDVIFLLRNIVSDLDDIA